MVGWCESRIRQVAAGLEAAGQGGSGGRWLTTYSFVGFDELEEVLARRGYGVVRLGADMRRDDLSILRALSRRAARPRRHDSRQETRVALSSLDKAQ